MIFKRPVLGRRFAGSLLFLTLQLASPAAHAQAADEIVAQARAAASASNNQEAARLFEEAIRSAPERRGELLLEFADQLAFAGRPGEAVPLYRERLADAALAPGIRARAERGLAFALLWSSQFEEAIGALQAIADAAPGDAEARKALVDAVVGAARAAAGRGANREAAAFFERALALDPGRRLEIGREYADQIAYAGEPDRAVPLYRERLARTDLAPEERQRTERSLAFALLWSSQFDDAVRAWEPVLRENPGDEEARKAYADALVGGARQAAGESRNAQAAALFAQALKVAPERRRELLREYADQVLYAGQPLAAIPLYQEVLQRADLPPAELRAARLGLARAYSWTGQPDLGLPFYTAILRVDPLDFEALIGRGQALNAVAAHRAALADFEVALRLRPGNADALRGAARAETSLGLHRVAIGRIAPLVAQGDRNPETLRIVADARRAMGRPDLAEDAALAILSIKPDDEGAQRLLEDLYRERRPLAQVEASQIRRSDDLRINGILAFTEFTFDRGLVKVAPQARHLSHRGGAFPDVDVYSIGLRGRQRFNDWLEFRTDFFVNAEQEPDDEDVTFTHDTMLSFIPSDVWRINLQAVRRYPDENPVSIVNDVFQNDFGGSVEFTPSYDLKVTGRGYYSTYTDGNERVWGQLEMARRVSIKPDILLGARLTAFDFKRVLDNGYWNPDRYQSAEATFQSYGPITEKLSYDVQLAGGWAWTQPGTDGAVYAGTARLNYQFHPDATVSLFANHLTSHVRSGETGGVADEGNDRPFRRNVVGAQLQVRLGTPVGVFAPDRKPPPPAPALPAFTWTGFYTGVNVGWGFDEDAVSRGRLVTPRPGGGTFAVRPAVPEISFFTPARVNNDDGGLTGGIQIGYDIQHGMVVAGLEADLQFIDLGDVPGRRLPGTSTFAATHVRPGDPTFGIQPPIFGDPNVFFRSNNLLNDEHNIDAFATLRGRLGVAFDRTLVYATGGLAWKTDGSDSGGGGGRPVAGFYSPLSPGAADRGRRVLSRAAVGPDDDEEFGFAAGGGIEYAFTTRLVGRLEGLYADFSNSGGRDGRIVGVTNTGRAISYTARVDDTVRFGLFRTGLNFRFETW